MGSQIVEAWSVCREHRLTDRFDVIVLGNSTDLNRGSASIACAPLGGVICGCE